jgi:FMN-dependent oxidoreductase (nitrilotriacetate monooxygenase family)
MAQRQLRLGAFFSLPGNHLGGWRHPDAAPDANTNFANYLDLARVAERGLYDAIFFRDTAAVAGADAMFAGDRTRSRLARIVMLEPVMALAGMASVTQNIGLIATATTTYNEPYHIARRFATLDHMSGGRAGWNLVTSQFEDEAANFGLDKHPDHADRYARAGEFYDVVAGLWDSWEEDAFLYDKAAGEYFDFDKMHFLNHKGAHFSVRGPLNLPRTPQGRPIVAQAGSSGPGMDLAARTADLVFTAQIEIPEAQAFYRDLKARVAQYGRAPGDLLILPGLTPVVAPTMAEARAKHEQLQELMPDDVALSSLARLSGGLDLRQFPLDGPLPPLPPTNSGKSRQQLAVDLAKKHGMTLRQIARHVASAAGHRVIVGTPVSIADEMQDWLEADAADGFNVICNHYPVPFVEFTETVIPELQRRGIFRTAYAGPTLRENLGLSAPRNRYAA